MNGSGTPPGDDRDSEKEEEGKVLHFPTLAERDRARKVQKARENQEKQWRAQYKGERGSSNVPFFNFDKIPPFTRGLVAAFLIVHFLLYFLLNSDQILQIFYTFGFVPGYFTGTVEPFPLYALLGPITHVFIHGSWMHLFFNSVMALALGMFFERMFGARVTAFFFFVCALAGAVLFFVFDPFSTHPLIGASGGISGLFGALIMTMARSGQMGTLAKRGPWPIIVFWLVFMVLMGLIGGGSLAWQAHIGGFLAGIGLLHLLQTGQIRF